VREEEAKGERIKASGEAVREELVQFLQVLQDDEALRAWFESFADVAPQQRAVSFTAIAAKMQAAGEHASLVQATALLADAGVYDGFHRALRELRG
jgi:hypothetical protein